MKGARCGAEEEERIVQHRSVVPWLGSRFQLGYETAKFFAEKATIDTEVFPAVRLLRLVGKLVGKFESDCSGEVIADANPVFTANLIRCQSAGYSPLHILLRLRQSDFYQQGAVLCGQSGHGRGGELNAL